MLRMIKIFAVKWKRNEKMYHPMVPELVQTSSFYFPTYEEFMAASIDEKIIMFTHVAPTPQQKF